MNAKLIIIAVTAALMFTACEKDNTNPISSNGIENQKQTVSNSKSSLNYTYYQSIEEFTSVVNNAISSGEALAASTSNSHGFSIVKNSNGYGISEITPKSGSDVGQQDVSLCNNCGGPLAHYDIEFMFNVEPCWWLIDFTDGVWGWHGCE